MKRILFLHQVSYIGGGSYCLLSLLKAIDRNIFEPVVLLGDDGPLRLEIEKLGIKVYFSGGMPAIPYNHSLFAIDCIPSYLKVFNKQKSFLKVLHELNVDIVYLNNMMLYPYLKTAKKFGCKTVMHVREHWPYNEHQVQFSWAKKYAGKYADSLVAINKFSASMFPECSIKTHIVYDWIDFTHRDEPISFDNIFKCDTSNLKIMVFTGGITRIKGTYEVVRAFEKLKGDNYRLLILGGGEEYSFSGVIGVLKKIRMLTGWKPYAYKSIKAIKKDKRIVLMTPTYKLADVLRKAYCTLSYYNIPHANLALAESVVLGTIAVAPRTDESLEYTEGGNAAILYNYKDQDDFYNKIEYVINNYDVIKKNIANYSDSVAKKFSQTANSLLFNSVLKLLD